MLAHHAPWVARAWQHWHRPWAVTHASWLDERAPGIDTGSANELALRLHYPAWCQRHELESTLTGFEDTPWWRLFSLAPEPFEQAVRRVGLTLMFAAEPRQRLLRGAADMTVVRWALERAHFVPEPVVAALGGSGTRMTAEAHAALSLRWCVEATPSLWSRMRLRFAREHVPADGVPRRLRRCIDPAVCTHLARLWRAGARIGQEEVS